MYNTAYVLHPVIDTEPKQTSEEMLSEIVNLAINLNIVVSEKKIINIRKINSSTLIGSGMLSTIGDVIKNNKRILTRDFDMFFLYYIVIVSRPIFDDIK